MHKSSLAPVLSATLSRDSCWIICSPPSDRFPGPGLVGTRMMNPLDFARRRPGPWARGCRHPREVPTRKPGGHRLKATCQEYPKQPLPGETDAPRRQKPPWSSRSSALDAELHTRVCSRVSPVGAWACTIFCKRSRQAVHRNSPAHHLSTATFSLLLRTKYWSAC